MFKGSERTQTIYLSISRKFQNDSNPWPMRFLLWFLVSTSGEGTGMACSVY